MPNFKYSFKQINNENIHYSDEEKYQMSMKIKQYYDGKNVVLGEVTNNEIKNESNEKWSNKSQISGKSFENQNLPFIIGNEETKIDHKIKNQVNTIHNIKKDRVLK